MKSAKELKQLVKDKYSEIAQQDREGNQSSCCGSGPSSKEVYNIMTDRYDDLKGYQQEADLGLGCGLPTQFAHIQKGHTVIDLGSGAGNDAFVARHEVGPEGKVLGIDFSDAMIQKARTNAEKLGFNNVEFRSGDIEAMPVSDNIADVIVSNCVLNLVPDKNAVFREIYRTLKPGGHFSISDIVLTGTLPKGLQEAAEMYAGCVSGAIQKEEYLGHIRDCGFEEVVIQKDKPIHIPEDILSRWLSAEEVAQFQQQEQGIFSITVFGRKPGQPATQKATETAAANVESNCAPGSGCC